MIEIRLLGGVEIRRAADRVPPLDSARVESLLAYLALHRHAAQQRQRIAFALWPDSSEAQALTNLRHVLHNLRRSLPDAGQLIDARPEEIGHPYSQTVGLVFASLLALDMNDMPELRRFVERAKMTAPDGAGVQVEGAIAALDAYLGILDGEARDGIARIQRVVADARDADQAAPGLRSALLRILLAACDAAGDADTGVAATDELIALSSSVVWRPEAQRLREKFLAKPHPTRA